MLDGVYADGVAKKVFHETMGNLVHEVLVHGRSIRVHGIGVFYPRHTKAKTIYLKGVAYVKPPTVSVAFRPFRKAKKEV